MASNKSAIFVKNPKTPVVQILPADTTTAKTIVTAGAEGSLIDSISVTSTDTSAVIIVISIGTTPIGEIIIPAGSGTDGTSASVNLLQLTQLPFLQSNGSLPLGALGTLSVAAKVTITAATQVDIVAYYGDY